MYSMLRDGFFHNDGAIASDHSESSLGAPPLAPEQVNVMSRRVTPSTYASPYNSKRWRTERLEHLRNEPFCRFCAEQGRMIPAAVIDHIKPWRGDLSLFWNRANWQSLCKTCHDGAKQRFEKSGHLIGSNAAGMPLDPNHLWNK